MKQLKLMLLMAFFSLGFASLSSAQTLPAPTITITRNVCLPGYSGCYNGAVTLKLSATIGNETHTFPAATNLSQGYLRGNNKITVTIGGLTSTGTYTLPTVIGDQVIITSGLDDGAHHAYTVGITKTGTSDFVLTIGDFAY